MMERPVPVRVLMLPWLAHGHISPYLELARRLSSLGNDDTFRFTLCSTRVNLLSVGSRHLLPVDFVELQLPQLAPELHTTKHLPARLIPALKVAFDLAEPAFADILDDLRPDLLLHDTFMPWAPTAASRRGIPSVAFITTGAAALSSFYQNMVEEKPDPLPALAEAKPETKGYRRVARDESPGMSRRERLMLSLGGSSSFVLIKSFREAEGPYIDYLNNSAFERKEHVPVGPLVQDRPLLGDEDDSSELMQWLDKKERSSVVFASFGSEYFMEEEELREVKEGLEGCGLDFIWVVRSPMGVETEERRSSSIEGLRVGFSERHVILQGWAPQGKILAHVSTGGFLTHCGWGSVMEAMRYGVPMAAMPCQVDQPMNARVAVEVGVAVEVPREAEGKYRAAEVSRVVREVVLGEAVRRRAAEMRKTIEEKGDEELHLVSRKLVQLASRRKDD